MGSKSSKSGRRPRKWLNSSFGRWSVLALVAAGVGGLLLAGNLFSGSSSVPIQFPSVGTNPASEAYSFAVDHPEILRYIPCYCGCVALGHRNNEECFVSSRPENGTVVLESHGGA